MPTSRPSRPLSRHLSPINNLLLLSLLTPSITSATHISPLYIPSAPIAPLPPPPAPPPLLIWHGLGDTHTNPALLDIAQLANDIYPGTYVYNVRLDDDADSDRRTTFFGNLTEQISAVCAAIASHDVLGTAGTVDGLGFSQGGQFLRGMVQRCTPGSSPSALLLHDTINVGHDESEKNGTMPRMRSLVTFGAQHNGITRFSDCAPGNWLCRGAMALLRSSTWGGFVQGTLVPAQYYRPINESSLEDEAEPEPSDEYIAYSNFLADINGERAAERNGTYAANLAGLSRFVMYVFENDTTVAPRESGWFAEVVPAADGDEDGEGKRERRVIPLRERRIYKEDWIGLRALDYRQDGKGLVFRKTEGGHMDLTDEVLEEAITDFFGPPVGRDQTVEAAQIPLDL